MRTSYFQQGTCPRRYLSWCTEKCFDLLLGEIYYNAVCSRGQAISTPLKSQCASIEQYLHVRMPKQLSDLVSRPRTALLGTFWSDQLTTTGQLVIETWISQRFWYPEQITQGPARTHGIYHFSPCSSMDRSARCRAFLLLSSSPLFLRLTILAASFLCQSQFTQMDYCFFSRCVCISCL